MVVVHLMGGLGNQLFQYALGRKISISNNQQLFFDVSSYKNDYLNRKLSLQNFNTKGKVIANKYFQKIVTPNTKLNKVFRKLSFLDEKIEEQFKFKPEVLNAGKAITYYSGFWQSYKYFDDIRGYLLSELLIETDSLTQVKTEVQKFPTSVAIHIRRKDYLNDDRYGFLGEGYYLKALQLLDQIAPGAHRFIFSDDVDWCKNNLQIESNITYISDEFNLTDVEELFAMSLCSHHIIANSSFSWWGAWLCKNKNQVVLRPAKPFNDTSLLYENYYPDTWISVN